MREERERRGWRLRRGPGVQSAPLLPFSPVRARLRQDFARAPAPRCTCPDKRRSKHACTACTVSLVTSLIFYIPSTIGPIWLNTFRTTVHSFSCFSVGTQGRLSTTDDEKKEEGGEAGACEVRAAESKREPGGGPIGAWCSPRLSFFLPHSAQLTDDRPEPGLRGGRDLPTVRLVGRDAHVGALVWEHDVLDVKVAKREAAGLAGEQLFLARAQARDGGRHGEG